MTVCSDCGGSGLYEGFNSAPEACRACGGSGKGIDFSALAPCVDVERWSKEHKAKRDAMIDAWTEPEGGSLFTVEDIRKAKELARENGYDPDSVIIPSGRRSDMGWGPWRCTSMRLSGDCIVERHWERSRTWFDGKDWCEAVEYYDE